MANTSPKCLKSIDNYQVPNTKLLVVDDDNFARSTVAGALSMMGYQVVAAAAANQALTDLADSSLDVAILDLDLGTGPTGVDLAFILRKRHPNLGLVFLTSYSDPKFLNVRYSQLPTGARYLTKSNLTNLTQLVMLINQAYVSPLKANSKVPKSEFRLSGNQIKILKLIADGKTTNQIAERLMITPKAVEGVISRINSNLSLTNLDKNNRRVQLVRAYYKLIGKL
jgi:DNA-binding NarL/FixJ family response regulator